MLKWQKSTTSNITIFFPFGKLKDHVSSLQQGHANFPLVLHPDRFSYARKSLIVYKIDTCNWNVSFIDASYVSTPFSHNSFNSSIKGYKYTSMSFLGALGLGISVDIMK